MASRSETVVAVSDFASGPGVREIGWSGAGRAGGRAPVGALEGGDCARPAEGAELPEPLTAMAATPMATAASRACARQSEKVLLSTRRSIALAPARVAATAGCYERRSTSMAMSSRGAASSTFSNAPSIRATVSRAVNPEHEASAAATSTVR